MPPSVDSKTKPWRYANPPPSLVEEPPIENGVAWHRQTYTLAHTTHDRLLQQSTEPRRIVKAKGTNPTPKPAVKAEKTKKLSSKQRIRQRRLAKRKGLPEPPKGPKFPDAEAEERAAKRRRL